MADFASLADHQNDPHDYRQAKELRRQSSLVEQILRHNLRSSSKKLNIRFRHQHPISPYIVDFACLKLRLVIEIDGSSHDTQLEKDRARENYLRKLGYEVMRFTNEDVLKNVEGVVLTILKRVEERATLLHTPLP